MDDPAAKTALHDELRWAREAVLAKLDGLGEYDVRRPLTPTGMNLLGLVKQLSTGEALYLGAVFERPFTEPVPWWDDDAPDEADSWVTAEESREDVVGRYRRACAHADATIDTLDLDARGHVAWRLRPEVRLVNVVAHVLAETNRHAGHADILREQLDGTVGDADTPASQHDTAWWRAHVATVEAAARQDAAGTPG